MKALKFINLTFISLFILCLGLRAQPRHLYDDGQLFNGNGYTYISTYFPGRMVFLYNYENKINVLDAICYKDGSSIEEEDELMSDIDYIVDDGWSREKCDVIIDEAFTDAEKKGVLKGGVLGVYLVANTTTGKVEEVTFSFHAKTPFATINFERYRQIELRLKNEIWFTLTDIGKKLEYLRAAWNNEF